MNPRTTKVTLLLIPEVGIKWDLELNVSAREIAAFESSFQNTDWDMIPGII